MAHHLILGGTGTVGSAVTRTLLARGETVRVLTRSAERGAALPTGATPVVGDLLDPASYERIFAGVDTVFLLNALSTSELQEGLAAVHECRRATARRIVYLSVQQVDTGPHIPHFATKIAIERALHESGLGFTILRPSNFYQNDYWFQDAIAQHGVYPQPIGDTGVSRVDVRDIAEAAANALLLPGHEGKTYALVGPHAWTGKETAAEWGRALGRDVKYAGNDLDAWYAQATRALPAWLAYDFRLMYDHFQRHGLRATDRELSETQTIVGAPPRTFEDFARETAAEWVAART